MSDQKTSVGRREFIGAAAAAGVTILKPSLVFGTQANSAVRLALLGCGGRGTNVTASFLENTGAVVTALGDLFADQLEKGKAELDAAAAKAGKPAIDPKNLFRGPDAYKKLFASSDVDAVYIATPPYYHPMHLEAALAAGKHTYVEKPVAVDVPGAKKVVSLIHTASRITCSAKPKAWNISIDRTLMPSAWPFSIGASLGSTSMVRICGKRASCAARHRPAGPEPAISTSTSVGSGSPGWRWPGAAGNTSGSPGWKPSRWYCMVCSSGGGRIW